jgi:nucleotide-binding universal stress UspA family protein
MTFKTILVAVDGSTHAIKTVEVAADVAQRYGAKLVILHVVARIFEGRVRSELENFASMEHMEQTEYEMLKELGRAIVNLQNSARARRELLA